MQLYFFCLAFFSTVSVVVLIEVKQIYVIERDFKTGQLRARRQNVPTPSHTQARVGALDQLHQHMFNLAMSPPPLQGLPVTTTGAGGLQQQQQQQQLSLQDLASAVDLTADKTPIDYLTPPPNADFQYQNFQPTAAAEPTSLIQTEAQPHRQNAAASATAAVHAPPPPPPLQPFTAAATSQYAFTPSSNGGFSAGGLQAQPPPTTPLLVPQLSSSPSNQVNSLSYAGPSLEQFTPYTPTLAHEPAAANHPHLQPPQLVQQNGGTRWELGFDANDILTPPFATGSEQPGGGGGQAFFQQDFGPEAASSVRHNKQYAGSGSQFFSGGFDPAVSNNNRFTPSDAVVVRPSVNNNNVYWGTPKTAQQQPLRPSPTFAEPNAFRFNNNNNNVHLHHGHHVSNNNHHQYVDTFQMPFTGQFDGPLSQGTVADHVVHGSFRIKRELQRDEYPDEEPLASSRRDGDGDDEDDGQRFGDRKPVYSFVKTDRNGNFKWSVRHGY